MKMYGLSGCNNRAHLSFTKLKTGRFCDVHVMGLNPIQAQKVKCLNQNPFKLSILHLELVGL